MLSKGFRAAGVACGIKKGKNKGKKDLALFVSDAPCSAAATFTTNKVQAAPIRVSREHVAAGRVQAILANSGNANCCTGLRGMKDARDSCAHVGRELGLDRRRVFVASTGVIGVPLPMDRLLAGVDAAACRLSYSPKNFIDAAEAIMTTDLRRKIVQSAAKLDGGRCAVWGCAKGSGMIQPRMATMFSFILTDAAADSVYLSRTLRAVVNRTFNRVTVDSDTSTNDCVVLLANGRSGGRVSSPASRKKFESALFDVCDGLARMLAADGEGATAMMTVCVSGAKNDADAELAARTVANSPLVKTAVHGRDANWGRILAALGRSGAAMDPDRTEVRLGALPVFRAGAPVKFSERRALAILSKPEVAINIRMGLGRGSARVYGCDLSAEYVRINGAYRT